MVMLQKSIIKASSIKIKLNILSIFCSKLHYYLLIKVKQQRQMYYLLLIWLYVLVYNNCEEAK